MIGAGNTNLRLEFIHPTAQDQTRGASPYPQYLDNICLRIVVLHIREVPD